MCKLAIYFIKVHVPYLLTIIVQLWCYNLFNWCFVDDAGLITGYGAGLIRSALVDRTKVADVIPVDLCTSMMCVIGWKTSKRESCLDENLNQSIPLYNFTSGQNKPFTWRDFEVLGKKHTGKYPFEYMLWLPGKQHNGNTIYQ